MVSIVRPREPGNTRISTTGGSGDADGSFVSGLVAAGYGRARLWLGMSAVGTIVILSTVALALGLIDCVAPDRTTALGTQLLALVCFILIYAFVQLPFDVLGGYLLPRKYGRSHPLPGRYALNLARGVAAHTGMLLIAAIVLMYAGMYAGVAGTIAAGALLTLVLLRGRLMIASVVARLELTRNVPVGNSSSGQVPVTLGESSDEGFTGAILGVFRPQLHLVPLQWNEVLGVDGLQLTLRRRCLAIFTGSWQRGRLLAVLFTLFGLMTAANLVGPDRLGTVAGTIELSLWFTIWSFVCLLLLPTLSRWGVSEVDAQLLSEGYPHELVETTARRLNDLQDGERDRPALVETIFHPIPSLEHRLRGPQTHGRLGFWDVARTSVYLSLAGLGLLGRAVHCNCGRPALWVFLPTD